MMQLGQAVGSHVPFVQMSWAWTSHWFATQQAPPKHDAEPEHVTLHVEPPHEMAPPQEEEPEQTTSHAEDWLQSMFPPQAEAPHVTLHGIPGGHTTPPLQPRIPQSTTQ